ncbi:MAG: hypothetical protein ACTSRW_11980 [Candidatus Helarchaeota archaeon]
MQECDVHYCLENIEKLASSLSREELLKRIPPQSKNFYETIAISEKTPEDLMKTLNLKAHEFKVLLTFFRDINWVKLIEKDGKTFVQVVKS